MMPSVNAPVGHVRAQDRGQAETRRGVVRSGVPAVLPPPIHQLRTVYPDTSVGQALRAIAAHVAVGVQREIALRRLRRTVDHDQVRESFGLAWETGEIEVGPDVAVDQQEGFVAQQGQGMQHAAAGFQRRGAFVRIADAQAPA